LESNIQAQYHAYANPHFNPMTVLDDIRLACRASDIADQALDWFKKHPSVEFMEREDIPVTPVDFGDATDRIWYLQNDLLDRTLNFGHAVMRPGEKRFAEAMVNNFSTPGGPISWVIATLSDHPDHPEDLLGTHVTKLELVHEAAHFIDFTRTTFLPKSFQQEDYENLPYKYYNTPHEYNAFFVQGLFMFLGDIGMVRLRLRRAALSPRYSRKRALSQIIRNGQYWQAHFVNNLNPKYARKLFGRCFRVFEHLGLLKDCS